MRAVKPGDHEERRTELRRAPGIAPGTHAFEDQLGPFERLHADEARAKGGGREHQRRRFHPVLAVAVIHRHRHGSRTADQDEGHDGDEEQRHADAAYFQGENLAGVGPRLGRRHAHGHVGDEKARKNKRVAEEEYPHHGLPPGHRPEGALIRRPVGSNPTQARLQSRGMVRLLQRRVRRHFLASEFRSQAPGR